MYQKQEGRHMPTIRVPKLSGSHPLVLANAVVVRLNWSFNGVLGFNVLGGSVGGGYTNSQAHANALGTAVLGRFTSSGLKALMATTTSLLGVGIRDVRTANQVEYVSVASAVPGTGSGDPLPNELAAALTYRTALAGKSFRGRSYFSGAIVGESDAAGKIVIAFNTALVAFMTGVQSDMGTEGITLAILSRPRYLNLPPPADLESYAGALTPVTAIIARDVQWDSQRRRQS
jgi:hypothetical protein